MPELLDDACPASAHGRPPELGRLLSSSSPLALLRCTHPHPAATPCRSRRPAASTEPRPRTAQNLKAPPIAHDTPSKDDAVPIEIRAKHTHVICRQHRIAFAGVTGTPHITPPPRCRSSFFPPEFQIRQSAQPSDCTSNEHRQRSSPWCPRASASHSTRAGSPVHQARHLATCGTTRKTTTPTGPAMTTAETPSHPLLPTKHRPRRTTVSTLFPISNFFCLAPTLSCRRYLFRVGLVWWLKYRRT